MDDIGQPFLIDVTAAGQIARDALRAGGRACIGAVFERSFYLRMREAWLCVACPSIAMGPLVLRCDVPEETDWHASGAHSGMAAFIGDTSVHLRPRFFFSFANAATWIPPTVSDWTRESLERGVISVDRWMRDHHAGDEGLSEFIHPRAGTGPKSDAARRAMKPVGSLRKWLATVMANSDKSPEAPSDAIDGLIGLGPGLTPSGDDFLGGAMIGLRILGRPELSARLFGAVKDKVALRSNAISAIHLAAAAEGAGSEWLHAALNRTLAGDAGLLPTALKNVDRIGHTSGWDAFAGAVTVLKEWVACETAAPVS